LYADAPNTRINTVGQREIDDAKFPPEEYRRLGAPFSQLVESGTAPPGQNESHGVFGQSTDVPLLRLARHGVLPRCDWFDRVYCLLVLHVACAAYGVQLVLRQGRVK